MDFIAFPEPCGCLLETGTANTSLSKSAQIFHPLGATACRGALSAILLCH